MGGDSQSDNEGVGNLRQHLLLIVDVLLLFQPDDVRDFHLFQGVESACLLVLN